MGTSLGSPQLLFHDKLLAHVTFYDFVCHFRKERKGGSFKEEGGQYKRFFFLHQHKEQHSHMLLETIRETNVHPKHEVVPRVVGTSIPCCDSDPESYFLFMLAHFYPFLLTMTSILKVEIWRLSLTQYLSVY